MNKFERLFKKWNDMRPDYRDSFCKDGIIDEDKWKATKRKILFVLKETHDYSGDLRKLIRDEWDIPKSVLWQNIARCVKGIQDITVHGFPSYKAAHEYKKDSLTSAAILNLKKTAGGASSKMKEIEKFALNDAKFIKEELELIKPDVIVCGATFNIFQKIFELDNRPIDEDKYLYKYKNMIVIDYWHPATRYSSHMYYYTLCSVYQRSLKKGG